MLQLNVPDKYSGILMHNPTYTRFDANLYTSSRFGGGYIYSKYVGGLFIPLIMRDYDIQQITAVLGTRDINNLEQEGTINSIIDFDTLESKRITYIKLYTPNPKAWAITMDPDIYQDIPEAINQLYAKCYAQVYDRQTDRALDPPTVEYAVKMSRAKHIVVVLTNVLDEAQASDSFLTIGVLPLLFADIKETLADAREQAFFKALVKRSQLKRISNVDVSDCHTLLIESDIYDALLQRKLWDSAITAIVNNKILNARSTLLRAQNKAEDLLQDYSKIKEQYFTAQKVLKDLEENREQTIKEIKESADVEGIEQVKVEDTIIKERVVVPMCFYDIEAASIALNNGQYKDTKAVELLKDIFLEGNYKLYVVANYSFNFAEKTYFNATPNISIDTFRETDALYNPHIKYYSCFGDYRPQIDNAYVKKDLLIFNNLVVASTKSMNFTDGVVTNRFIQDLNDYIDNDSYMLNLKCLEDKEGNRISIKDWLSKKGEEL